MKIEFIFMRRMTGDIGESMIVRFEGKSRVKGNTKKFNRCRSRDNLTVNKRRLVV